jgi:hypothetical protein
MGIGLRGGKIGSVIEIIPFRHSPEKISSMGSMLIPDAVRRFYVFSYLSHLSYILFRKYHCKIKYSLQFPCIIACLFATDDPAAVFPGVVVESHQNLFLNDSETVFFRLDAVDPEYPNSANGPPKRVIVASSSLR